MLQESEGGGVSVSDFPQHTDSFSSPTTYQPPLKKQKCQSLKVKQNVQHQSAFHQSKKSEPYDECQMLGKFWGYKLKNFRPEQRKLVERVVNDIFFKAEMKILSVDSVEAIVGGSSLPPVMVDSEECAN